MKKKNLQILGFILKKRYIYIYLSFTCMSVSAEGSTGHCGTGAEVSRGCKLLCEYLEPNPVLLKEQPSLKC